MNLDPLVCEVIAKRWCGLMGLDPYNSVPEVPGSSTYRARWQVVAREVPAQVAWYRAISGQEE